MSIGTNEVTAGLELDGRFAIRSVATRGRNRTAQTRVVFSTVAALADATAIVATVLVVGTLYHLAMFGEPGVYEMLLQLGGAIAICVLVPNIVRGDYDIGRYLDATSHLQRLFPLWNMAFLSVMALGFLTKIGTEHSRATVVIVYGVGIVVVLLTRRLLVRLVQIGSKTGTIEARRIFLVGSQAQIELFARTHQPWNYGMHIVGTGVLSATDSGIDEIVARARSSSPDDVFLLFPWSERAQIDAYVQRLLAVPCSIHVSAEPVLDRFQDLTISRVGSVTSLQLVRRPLTAAEVAVKRVFDIVGATMGLLLLAPLFVIVAIAIKLDSKGPVFFVQRRYGFNQQPFRIFKFRSMTTMDDGPVIVQAAKNDKRITRVGGWLRRTNIDELPQLLNVLLGHMSLVGPRPHALAHDREFERKLALYARRLNVRPGITGWAQVNGFRGQTETDAKMQSRLEHDLYYIDNWSLWLDLLIIVRTVFSMRSYRNAH
jgi:Undecaprenyl-phosphate glucose phosphotransferase